MRAAWFRRTASHETDPTKLKKAQDDAVTRAKIIFEASASGYQAEMDAESEESDATPKASAAPLQSSQSSSSFLDDFCDIPDITPLEVPTMSRYESLQDELKRYYAFEGGKGDLFDPLAWWKVQKLDSSHSLVVLIPLP